MRFEGQFQVPSATVLNWLALDSGTTPSGQKEPSIGPRNAEPPQLLVLCARRPRNDQTISRIRHLIRTLSYVVSTHAAEELEDDNLSVLDLENIALTGQIIERQRDVKTREAKYVIAGTTLEGDAAEAVVKIAPTGRLIVLTVYLC